MSLTEQQAPFTEPYSRPGNPSGFKSKGPTAEAVKRALAHLGFMDWQEDFDQTYGDIVYEAAAAWKRKRGIIPENSTDGSWGKKAHDVMRGTWYEKDGEHLDAFDGGSQKLLKQEKADSQPPPPDDPHEAIRAKLTEFCNRGMGEPDWNYSQNRAVDVTVNPDGPVTSDCSGSVIQAYKFAGAPDPAKYGYAGYGNTWDDCDGHPKVTNGQYKVGDLAHYEGHVCLCMKAGNADSADWWSFGSEPPSKRKLDYRSDFKFVVRPPLSEQEGTYSTTFERFTFAFRIWKLQRIVFFRRNGKRRGDPPTDPQP